MIVVIASMSGELAFTEKARLIKEKIDRCFLFREYEYMSKKFATCVCGSGKVFAALYTQKAIDTYSPNLVINIGTSGSLGKAKTKDIIIGTDCIQYDFDCSPFGWRKAEVCGTDTIAFPCDDRAVAIARKYFSECSNILFGRVLSADRVIIKKEDQIELANKYSGLCCEMEAAGISQTCWLNKTSYMLIKAISDGECEENERENEFRKNITLTAAGNAEVALKIISEY